MQIAGATALITGGVSGLGEATAERLIANGGNVLLADVNVERGNATVERLGKNAAFLPADVTSPEQVQTAVDAAVEKFGRLDILVNCAGVGLSQRTVSRTAPHDLDAFKRVININLIGTFNAIRLAAFCMSANTPGEDGERGVIINTASIAGYEGQIGQAAYSASKGGIIALTLTVARDLAGVGIRICTIAPGTFDTPLFGRHTEEFKQELASQIPFPRRMGRSPEYALLAQQIIENPMLNGETIRLDGALRMPPK